VGKYDAVRAKEWPFNTRFFVSQIHGSISGLPICNGIRIDFKGYLMKPRKTPKIDAYYSGSNKGPYRWDLGVIAFGRIRRINGKELRDKDGKIIE
jgi:hypothetical protein